MFEKSEINITILLWKLAFTQILKNYKQQPSRAVLENLSTQNESRLHQKYLTIFLVTKMNSNSNFYKVIKTFLRPQDAVNFKRTTQDNFDGVLTFLLFLF